MQDRVSLYPGRVKLTPVSGQENTYDMVRADEPTQEGTPLNKATLLKDATAALFGLGTDAVPDDVLPVIKTLIDNANTNANTKAKIETGSYTGNGNTQSGNPNSLTFGFVPKVVFICRDNANNFNVGLFFPIALTASYKQYGYAYINQGSGLFVPDRNFAMLNGNTLSWYYNAAVAEQQLNISGITYHYIAIG